MVTPKDRSYVPALTFDADFTDRACESPADLYVVEDSDDMCYVDFTPLGFGTQYGDRIQPVKPTAKQEADWPTWGALATHRYFVTRLFRFHADECSDLWPGVERQSDAVIRDILALVEGEGDSAIAVPPPSSGRYLSPQFWRAKLHQKSAGALARELWARGQSAALRQLWGSELVIRMVQ